MTLLIRRRFHGLGDWIMAMSVIKTINMQRPDIEVYVYDNFPETIRSVIKSFDVDVKITNSLEGFDYFVSHLIYDLNDYETHYIVSMLKKIESQHKLGLDPYSYVLSTCGNVSSSIEKSIILMHSQGKQPSNRGKDWGYQNFNTLAEYLSYDYKIVQVGVSGDPILTYAESVYFDIDILTLYALMSISYIYVGNADGLSVMAGVHSIPAFILYCSYDKKLFGNHIRNAYPNQHPIIEDFTPAGVYKQIMEGLHDR